MLLRAEKIVVFRGRRKGESDRSSGRTRGRIDNLSTGRERMGRLISRGSSFLPGPQYSMFPFIVRILLRQRLHFEPTKSLSLGQLSAKGLSSDDILVIRDSVETLTDRGPQEHFITLVFHALARFGLLIGPSSERTRATVPIIEELDRFNATRPFHGKSLVSTAFSSYRG